MDHFHQILEEATDHAKPGNQVDAESFISARNEEIQALLKEIRKIFKFVCNSITFVDIFPIF